MIIRGKNIEVTDAIRAAVERNMRKAEKLGAYDFHVLVKTHPGVQTCEVTASTRFGRVRAEASDTDLYSAIDKVEERLERQLVKAKEIREPHRRLVREDRLPEEEEIVRVKKVALKPMSDEEAIMQMELSDHDFYVYIGEEGDYRVIYKRSHGGYGLII